MPDVYRSRPAEPEHGVIWKAFHWMFDPNYAYDLNEGHRYNDPNYPHAHSWEFLKTIRNKWRVEGGRPVGKTFDIDDVIAATKENPSHTDTKLEMLEGWKSTGYELVHTSFNVYKCKICGVTANVEIYAAPIYKDKERHVTVIDFGYLRGGGKKTQTQKIPVPQQTTTPAKREFAVEKMKKYS